MDKLFEKALTFIIFSSFFVISYIIFNINEVEYRIKSERLIKKDIVAELKAPQWLVNHSICEHFSTYKRADYGITKCQNDKEVVYFKDYDDKSSFKNDYLYMFNKSKESIVIITDIKEELNEKELKDLTENIHSDFIHFLGVKYKEKSKTGDFKLINRTPNKEAAKFIMIKKEG